MTDLTWIPLSTRLRPQSLDDFFGQDQVVGEQSPLRRSLNAKRLHSMILWGPPGTGKTTLAHLIAEQCDAQFITLSAVLAGVKDIRAACEAAQASSSPTILFIDEIHRFNKSQQDALLPHVEAGDITLIGATTENPSFALNNALLSRARVYVLKSLDEQALVALLQRAISHELGLNNTLKVSEPALHAIAQSCDGDARRALNWLEMAADLTPMGETLSDENLARVLSDQPLRFDKNGDDFYDQISALHKSVRGSDPDAALYWFARMIVSGCDPLYLARRITRMASEDIGNADPRALELALNAWQAMERMGSPEGELALAQAVVYIACAAKSNAVYVAFNQAKAFAEKSGSPPVPLHLRNAPTKLMKSLDYGKHYRYAHDEPNAYVPGEHYFPEGIQKQSFYQPVSRGLEIKIQEKLAQLRALDQSALSK
jgi:putative ATPase